MIISGVGRTIAGSRKSFVKRWPDIRGLLNNNRLPINDRLKSTRDFNRLFCGGWLDHLKHGAQLTSLPRSLRVENSFVSVS